MQLYLGRLWLLLIGLEMCQNLSLTYSGQRCLHSEAGVIYNLAYYYTTLIIAYVATGSSVLADVPVPAWGEVVHFESP